MVPSLPAASESSPIPISSSSSSSSSSSFAACTLASSGWAASWRCCCWGCCCWGCCSWWWSRWLFARGGNVTARLPCAWVWVELLWLLPPRLTPAAPRTVSVDAFPNLQKEKNKRRALDWFERLFNQTREVTRSMAAHSLLEAITPSKKGALCCCLA